MVCYTGLIGLVCLGGCTPKAPKPSTRAASTLPSPDLGNIAQGKTLYENHCLNCHKLSLIDNKKGPHLLGIYGAPAAELGNYNYSATLRTSNWVWDAQKLDVYIQNPQAALPDSRMRTDGVASAGERASIIAYLATLAAKPAQSESEQSTLPQSELP